MRPILNRNTATSAINDSTAAAGSRLDQTGQGMSSGPASTCPTLPNRVCRPNQMARLRMTPTTAAVTAVSAPDTILLPESFST